MSKVTVSGKTVDEAVRLALSQLHTNLESVHVTIVEEPTRGFFGLGAKPAVVMVELKEESVKEDENEIGSKKDPLEEAQLFLLDVLKQMGLEVRLSVSEEGEHILFTVEGEKLGMMIGRRGQTLDALQYLTNIVANRYSSKYLRIILDAENYRARRKETLEQLADRLAKKVIRTRTKVVLEPMNPAERKIIHTFLQDYAGVTTKSEGVEPLDRKSVV